MIRTGCIVETPTTSYDVIPTPDYIVDLRDGEQVLRSRRTGEMVVATLNPVGFPRNTALARVVLFAIDTVVRELDGRPSVLGVRGRMIRSNARTNVANVVA